MNNTETSYIVYLPSLIGLVRPENLECLEKGRPLFVIWSGRHKFICDRRAQETHIKTEELAEIAAGAEEMKSDKPPVSFRSDAESELFKDLISHLQEVNPEAAALVKKFRDERKQC